ncbi:MAG: lipopolysaccharide biosynthesis protein [Desulfovibrio sp.]|nr:lipopolysaccharide biosynthesis protein [Desulfovibrio sp.]
MKPPRLAARLTRLARPYLATFFSFSAIQAAQLLLPLLALPWLARVLGAEAFGLLMYMSVLPPLITLVVDWGFPLGGAREAATLRGDKAALSGLLGAVVTARLLLALGCGVCGLLLLPVLPHAAAHPWAYGAALLMGVTRGLSPVWFAQGVGRGMERMAAWDVGSSLCALGLTVLVVRGPEEWPLYLLFTALCKGLAYGGLTLGLMRAWGARPALRHGWAALRRTRTLFASSVASTFSVSAGQLVLGYFLSAADMGLLVAVGKIVRALVKLLNPAIQTLFPELCARQGHRPASPGLPGAPGSPDATARLLRLFLVTAALCMLLAAALAWLLAPWLMRLALGPGYAGAVPVLRLMLPLVPLLGCDMVLGAQVLVPLGLEKQQNRVQWAAALLSLPLAALFAWQFGLTGGALLPVAAEALTFAGLWACVARSCPGALIPGKYLPTRSPAAPEKRFTAAPFSPKQE